ncbi:MAG: DoxX family protein [Bacteroidia bacterium]|nr:DoxX family protein [Bacteroidia bacterium]
MGIFYIYAGYSHFRIPKFFLKITPQWVPFPEKVNIAVGIVEILLGVLVMFEPTRIYAAWGIIVLLILVFPANIYHLTSGGAGTKVPIKFLWIRLPIQAILILWAWWYTN